MMKRNPDRDGVPVIGNFTFPELLSAFIAVGAYVFGFVVILLTNLSGELKAAIAGALIVQAISDVRGFWFGSSNQRQKGETK